MYMASTEFLSTTNECQSCTSSSYFVSNILINMNRREFTIERQFPLLLSHFLVKLCTFIMIGLDHKIQ